MKNPIVRKVLNPFPHVGLCIKYGAMTHRKGRATGGFDLLVPAGKGFYWQVDHGTWVDSYLTRAEARAARLAFLASP